MIVSVFIYIYIYIAVLQIRCKDYFFESEKFQLKSYYSAGTFAWISLGKWNGLIVIAIFFEKQYGYVTSI